MRLSPRNLAAAGLVTLLPSLALGGGIPTATQWLEEVVVTGKLERLGGEPALGDGRRRDFGATRLAARAAHR